MDKLKFINEQMRLISISYELGEWTKAIEYPYWVGEPTEAPTTTEDGYCESTLILSGFTRGKYITLEENKETIRKHFDPDYGCRASTDSGTIAVFFDGALYVPTGEADLKKMEINLLIKEWKRKGE